MADRLAQLAGRAAQTGVFLDFDGTLSQIVPDPESARLVPGATGLLRALVERYPVVAVISGRAVRDLARRVRVRGIHLIGLHGMEELHEGIVHVAAGAEAAGHRIDAAATELRRALRSIRGAALEHKGLALAVHTRRAADPDEADVVVAPIVHAVAADHDLVVVPGRRILELRPPSGGDKGRAVGDLITRFELQAGLVAGDDIGDLPAFAAMNGLELAVRIAVVSAEAPPDLIERADLIVKSPAALVEMLQSVVA